MCAQNFIKLSAAAHELSTEQILFRFLLVWHADAFSIHW